MIATVKSGIGYLRSRNGGLSAMQTALWSKLMPLMVLAIGVTVLVMLYLWHDQSNYKPVFGVREKISASEMMAVLDAEHIAYRLHPDTGQVLVPDDLLGKVRMLLAAKGVTAKLPAGLELMDRSDPLGVSQFVQDVRFRRGLEGELAQSISTLDAIESARVHLSIAKSTSFVASDGEKSSASVVLTMKLGRKLSPEQIAAIVSMVSGSVASLDTQRVSLVDQAGNLLSSHIDLTEGFEANSGNDSARRYQDEARRNVHDLLAPVLGEDNFKVSVTAAVDNDRIEETVEKYGETPRVTSEAVRDEQDRNRATFGVPGSLSNRPVSPPNAASGAEDGPSARKNATTRQYTYDRSITQTKRARGRLNKLNAAVVLNNSAAPLPKTGWTAVELAGIDRILRNGLGIDEKRGDTLVVSALAFPVPIPPGPWWQERDNVIDIGTWIAYAIATLLAFMLVVRPVLKMTQQRLAPAIDSKAQLALPDIAAASSIALALGDGTRADAQPAGQIGLQMPVVPLLENYDLPPPGSPVDVMVEHLKVLASKEPERVAEVVKQWVQTHGRSN